MVELEEEQVKPIFQIVRAQIISYDDGKEATFGNLEHLVLTVRNDEDDPPEDLIQLIFDMQAGAVSQLVQVLDQLRQDARWGHMCEADYMQPEEDTEQDAA